MNPAARRVVVSHPRTANRLRLLRERFLNRTDVLCHKRKKGPCPLRFWLPDQLVPALRSHLTGEPAEGEAFKSDGSWSERVRAALRLGAYMPAPDGRTVCACVDVDGESHKGRHVADALDAALRIVG